MDRLDVVGGIDQLGAESRAVRSELHDAPLGQNGVLEALLTAWEAEAVERGSVLGSNAYQLEQDAWIKTLGR